jgi:hypothetical protein
VPKSAPLSSASGARPPGRKAEAERTYVRKYVCVGHREIPYRARANCQPLDVQVEKRVGYYDTRSVVVSHVRNDAINYPLQHFKKVLLSGFSVGTTLPHGEHYPRTSV